MMTVLEQLHLCMIKKFHVAQVLHNDVELPVYINPLPVYICKAMN